MKFVLRIFIIWRIVLFITSYLAPMFLPFKESFPYWDTLLKPSGLPDWLWVWGNFDGVHYYTIANLGYEGFGTQVFFPLFPLLIAILAKLVGSIIISGLIISNTATLLAGIFLYKFVEKEFDDKTAKWAVAFLFCFPTSFFLGAIYPESLFLLLILLSFQAKGLWAGVFSGLASGTKLIGIFISPLLAFLKPRNIWGILGGTGLALFILYLWLKFNSPLMFLTAQSAFENHRASNLTSLVSPPQVVFRYLKIFITANWQHFDYWIALLEFAAFIFAFLALIVLSRRKIISPKIIIFSWVALILPIFSGTFSSMPRYLLPIFPLYIFLATLKNSKIKYGILTIFVLLLALLTTLFARGFFVS